MPRLFVAIDFPSAVKDTLAHLCAGVRRARWIAPTNFHLTLRFIGDVEESTAVAIAAALSAIEAPAFSLQLAGVGHFRGATIWAGVAESTPLMVLQREIEAALQRVGLAPDPRPYVPHVKLGRMQVRSERKLAPFLEANARFRGEPLFVETFCLMESRLTSGGAIYSHRADYRLRPVLSDG